MRKRGDHLEVSEEDKQFPRLIVVKNLKNKVTAGIINKAKAYTEYETRGKIPKEKSE